jgi:hypothetical protein
MTGPLNNVLVSGIIQERGEIIARKFDEFDLTEIHYDDMQARLDSFVTDALMKEPNSRAYLILYRRRNSYSRFYPWQLKDYLVNIRRLPANHVKAVYGGYRKAPMLELWVVPEGAADPKATPAIAISKRRKY